MHSAGEDTDFGAAGEKTWFDQTPGDENREETEKRKSLKLLVFNLAGSEG